VKIKGENIFENKKKNSFLYTSWNKRQTVEQEPDGLALVSNV
jgi:hypothetical protein